MVAIPRTAAKEPATNEVKLPDLVIVNKTKILRSESGDVR